MSSWEALSWAKQQRAGSPLGKAALLLLAERCDERFSCFPGVKTLAAEAEATEAGIRKVLAMLAAELKDGDEVLRGPLIVVERGRQRPNGSCTTNRYRLNHPNAPHLFGAVGPVDDAAGSPNSVDPPPSTQLGRPPNSVGGRGVNSVGAQNTPSGTTTTTSAREVAPAVRGLMVVVAEGLKGKGAPVPSARALAVEADRLHRLAWTREPLEAEIRAHDWGGIRAGGVVTWLRGLDEPPPPPAAPVKRGPWCGYCSDPTRRRAIDPDTGDLTAAPCPDCGGTTS